MLHIQQQKQHTNHTTEQTTSSQGAGQSLNAPQTNLTKSYTKN